MHTIFKDKAANGRPAQWPATHLFWAGVLGAFSFLYSLYDSAIGGTGGVSLPFVVVATISLIGLLWEYPRRVAIANYELGVLALWLGNYMGSDPWPWRILWGWTSSALFGGVVLAFPRKRPSFAALRGIRVGVVAVMALAGALLVSGYARILLFEKRPRIAFSASSVPILDALSFSPDGGMIATVGGYGVERRTARVWDTATGRLVVAFVQDEGRKTPRAATLGFLGDRLVVVTSCSGHTTAHVWNIGDKRIQERHSLRGEVYSATAVVSPNGCVIAYSDFDGHVQVFDLVVGRFIADLERTGANVSCLAIACSGETLACGTDDHKIEIWDIPAARQKRVISAGGKVLCLAFSPDGRLLASGTEGGGAEVIDIEGREDTILIPCFDDGVVSAVGFSPDGTRLACGGLRGLVKLVDTKVWRVADFLRTWGGWSICCLAFSPDGRRLATGNVKGRIGVWDLD